MALEQHTLVIPTYNRAELLERLIAYFAAAAPEMPILVLDSSRDEVKAQNAAMLARRAPKVRHATFASTIPMAQKLASGLEQVTTPTASFCADDDVVFPQELAKAVEFVLANPGYVCAHGVYINFRENEGCKIDITVEYAGPSIEANHPAARIFRLFQHYESLFYGAFRAADLLDIMREAAKAETLHFQELTQSVVAMIKGRVKQLTGFYAARRSGPEAEPGRERWQTFYWFADNSAEFLQHYAIYRGAIGGHYKRATAGRKEFELPEVEFNRAMDLSHAVYFGAANVTAYFHDRLKHLWPQDDFADPKQSAVIRRRLPFGLDAFIWSGNRGDRPNLGERALWKLRRLRTLLLGIEPPAVRRLNRDVARRHQTAWVANFGGGWGWLAGNAPFRYAYDELCRYLDGPPRDTGART